MTALVVVIIVLLALGALAGLIVLLVGRVVRFWSRTREQANVIYSVQMELMALGNATLQRCNGAAVTSNGNGKGVSDDAQARAALRRDLALLRDDHLRRITQEMLDCTRRLPRTPSAAEADRVGHEMQALQERFRARSNEVVRDMRLGRA